MDMAVGFSRSPFPTPIGLLARSAGTIFTNPCCRRRLKTPYRKRGYPSRQARTRFGILLRTIYLRMDTILEQYKTYLGIAVSVRSWSLAMYRFADEQNEV